MGNRRWLLPRALTLGPRQEEQRPRGTAGPPTVKFCSGELASRWRALGDNARRWVGFDMGSRCEAAHLHLACLILTA